MVHRRNTGRREGEKGGAAKGGGSRLQLDGRRNADLALVSRDSRKSVPLAERRAGLAVDRRSSSRWAASTRRVQWCRRHARGGGCPHTGLATARRDQARWRWWD
ncbi:proline-rich receptor-like protein kinase PERK9 [Iris pallida]|uniref:Proline-rich receptor-like protein kinase PERK9 n=1 Tax=Iris pallida TaxID=29817 RepID=A0AAX6GKQ5_IRIPA|nr:proline-rich receptor-like protein kinase PERK9 [Iris pallida]